MTPRARQLRIKEIFSEAAEADPEARDKIVEIQCGSDSEMAEEVRSLLRLSDADDLSLDRLVPSGITILDEGPPPRHNSGEVLESRYQIEHFLCAGGMGEVYAAIDLESGKAVALKFVHPFPVGGSQALARLHREVELAKSIHHPNVCRTIGLAGSRDEPFCVMELLDGETLAHRLANGGAMSPGEALPLALQICDGLTAAHAAGVLHRDLKPGNIFLVDGRAILIDFGLAAAIEHAGSLTSAGAVVGTLAYIAPEQLDGGTATTASDVYALGIILHEMLAGSKPFDAKSPLRIAAQKARRSVDTTRLRSVPALWEEVIGRCLHGNPAKRFQTPAEVKRALKRGTPSVVFVLTRPMVLWPLVATAALIIVWLAWTWSIRDYQPHPEAAALFAEAQQAMAQSAAWRGTQLLEQAVAKDPQFLQARSLLAVGYSDVDRLDKAHESILEATAAADRRWRIGRGERLGLDAARAVVMRDFPVASAAYRAMAENTRGTEHLGALLALARTSIQQGKPNDAIQILTVLSNASGGNNAGRVLLAGLFARKGQAQRAAAEFSAAEAEYARAGNMEGLCDVLLAKSGTQPKASPEKIRQDARKVLELSAKTGSRYHNLMAKFRLAGAEQAEGHFDRAMGMAREAASQAEREGMLGLAAMAIGDFGYGFVFLRRYEDAADALRQSVRMAERAKSQGILATNRLRLGEVLTSLNQNEEAIAIMRLAVDWYRQGGYNTTLPFVLIKWGTAIASRYPIEAEKAFQEALVAAERTGDEMFQSMALQRLAGFNATRNLRRSAEFHARALPFIRKVNNTGVFFQGAHAYAASGDFQNAKTWLAEGERQIAAYPDNLPRVFLTESAHFTRATLYYLQGKCEAALHELSQIRNKNNLATMGVSYESRLRRAKACQFPDTATGSLRWANERLNTVPPLPSYVSAFMAVAAGEFALRTGKWEMAKRLAERGCGFSREDGHTVYEFENLLVLRAAEMHLGNRERVRDITGQLQLMAPEIGIGASPEFRGRFDLKLLWTLAESR